MFVLIVSRDLTILFLTPGATLPFCPDGNAVGEPLRSAQSLLAVDPDLIEACSQVLTGAGVLPRELGANADTGYVRRIFLRPGKDGARSDEIVVTYQPGPLAPHAELDHLRTNLAQAMADQSDAVAYFDAEDRLTHCNQIYANMHSGPEGPFKIGMTFEQIIRRAIRHGMLRLTPDKAEAWVQERLAERTLPYLSRQIRQPDGRAYRMIERRTLDGGRMNLMIDISDLDRVEQRLREVLDTDAFGTFSFAIATGTLDLDERSARMLGYYGDELSALPRERWHALTHPADVSRIDAHARDVIKGHSPKFLAEFRMRHRDGHWVWLQTRGGLSGHDAEGRATRIAGIQLDISTQKRAEADLSLRATAITAASDGIVITDAEGEILDCNPACATMLGYDDPARMRGAHWSECFTIDATSLKQVDLDQRLRSNGTWMGPAIGVRQDGKTIEVELSFTKMPDGRFVWIARDVSARNALERERLDLAESVNRAHRQEIVNLLAAGLTHDLSNLTALIATLSDPVTKGFAKDGTDVMDEIHSAARQMVALLDPIRNLGRRKVMRECTDLGALLTEAAGILQLGAPAGLKVHTHLPDAPIQSELDPMQLMQVLLNLGLNARDALDEGPNRIDLSLKIAKALPPGVKLETGTLPDAPFALFRIKDTGSGIPPDIRSKIWEPFFTTKKLSGTGLGLFVVADIVRSAGGAIGVYSEVGKGTCFFIAWPLAAAPCAATLP